MCWRHTTILRPLHCDHVIILHYKSDISIKWLPRLNWKVPIRETDSTLGQVLVRNVTSQDREIRPLVEVSKKQKVLELKKKTQGEDRSTNYLVGS